MNAYRITIVTELIVETRIDLMHDQDEWQKVVNNYEPAQLPWSLEHVDYTDGSITIEELD
jgi:hypothetical protein